MSPGLSLTLRRGLGGRSVALAVLVAATPWLLGAKSALSVADGWFRVLTPQTPAAGYFTLSNAGDQPGTLVRASSPACGSLMLHRSMSGNGMEHMDAVDQVTVPAKGTVSFAPGSYHLMCMSPSPKLVPGNRVPVSLWLEDGTALTADFQVFGAKGR